MDFRKTDEQALLIENLRGLDENDNRSSIWTESIASVQKFKLK